MKMISRQLKLKIIVAGLLAASAVAGFAQKYETIDAQAYGTSTQMGKTARISLIGARHTTRKRPRMLDGEDRDDRERA